PPQSDKIESMDAVDGERGEGEGVGPENHGVERRHWIAVILLAAACALAPLATRRYGFVAFCLVYAVTVMVWLLGCDGFQVARLSSYRDNAATRQLGNSTTGQLGNPATRQPG